MDTSIWEARAGHSPAAMHQLQWPSLLVLSLTWVTECFLLPPTRLPAMTSGKHRFATILASSVPCSQTCCSSLVPGHFGACPPPPQTTQAQMGSLPWIYHAFLQHYLWFEESNPSSFPTPGNVIPKFPWNGDSSEGRGVARLTSNLVDILEGQAQGFVCGAGWGQDGVQGLQQGHPTGIAFFALHLPAFEPRHLGREQQQRTIETQKRLGWMGP